MGGAVVGADDGADGRGHLQPRYDRAAQGSTTWRVVRAPWRNGLVPRSSTSVDSELVRPPRGAPSPTSWPSVWCGRAALPASASRKICREECAPRVAARWRRASVGRDVAGHSSSAAAAKGWPSAPRRFRDRGCVAARAHELRMELPRRAGAPLRASRVRHRPARARVRKTETVTLRHRALRGRIPILVIASQTPVTSAGAATPIALHSRCDHRCFLSTRGEMIRLTTGTCDRTASPYQ
jgi:hypothetical protein